MKLARLFCRATLAQMSLPGPSDKPLLLHNPFCSKSRRAHALLKSKGIVFQERRYLDEPLDEKELRELTRRLGRSPSEWVRQKEKAFADAGLSESADKEDLIAAIARHPILMERPILVKFDHAVICRPPESILDQLPKR